MFGWSKRKKRAPGSRRRRLPERRLAPVEDIVEQGLLVADVAARMTVKNAIIWNALRHKTDYRESQIIEMVRSTLIELADEREQDADHIAGMRADIRRLGTSSGSASDYGNEDSKTLRHRQEVYARVATQLRTRAEDEHYLRDTAERARAAAWEEIGDSLKQKASHPYYAGGSSEGYKQEREGRIQLLIERDLTELIKRRSTKKSG